MHTILQKAFKIIWLGMAEVLQKLGNINIVKIFAKKIVRVAHS